MYAMPENVVKVFTTISKFTNYYFKKAQGSQGSSEYNTVICDVPVIGYFTFERGIDEPKYDFIPTPMFLQESQMMTDKKVLQISKYSDPVLRKELTVDKIASLAQMQTDVTNMILLEIIKQIVSYRILFPKLIYFISSRVCF